MLKGWSVHEQRMQPVGLQITTKTPPQLTRGHHAWGAPTSQFQAHKYEAACGIWKELSVCYSGEYSAHWMRRAVLRAAFKNSTTGNARGRFEPALPGYVSISYKTSQASDFARQLPFFPQLWVSLKQTLELASSWYKSYNLVPHPSEAHPNPLKAGFVEAPSFPST